MRLMVFSLLLISVILLYRKTLLLTIGSFSDPLANMSHGWLIPVVSVLAIWKQRVRSKTVEKYYSLIGILSGFASLVLLWFGNDNSLLWLRQLSFIGMLWSLVYALWGRDVAKLTLFPIWYLAFTVSISSILDNLILELQGISSTAGFYLMHGFGFEIFQQGNALLSGIEGSEFQFSIAGACSGIRSLIALTAFTAAYAWYTQRTVLKKWLLFACSMPIAILCNIIRVFSICLVAAIFGQETAVGYYHDYSGYVIVLLSILFIFQCGNRINFFNSKSL